MGTAQGGDAVAGGFDQGADWRAGYMPDEPHTRGYGCGCQCVLEVCAMNASNLGH